MTRLRGEAARITAFVAALTVTLSICTFGETSSQADEPSYDVRMNGGETIRFPLSVERGSAHYVGGLSYAYVPGSTGQVSAVCDDVEAWKVILPRTKEARLIGRRGDEMYVELTQGNALVEATYTLHVHFDHGGLEARFWMVQGRHHDIENAWGFFRFEPVTDVAGTNGGSVRTRVTFGVLVDLGAGFLSGMVEPKVQSAVLGVPDRLRQYVSLRAPQTSH